MDVLRKLEKSGVVKINYDFVRTFNNTYVIVDECQRLQNSSWVNHYGYALVCIRDLTNAFFIMISATLFNIRAPSSLCFRECLKTITRSVNVLQKLANLCQLGVKTSSHYLKIRCFIQAKQINASRLNRFIWVND